MRTAGGIEVAAGSAHVPDPQRPNNALAPLTELPQFDSETLLRACISAHRSLAELKGAELAVPDSRILLSALAVREVQGSSAIEGVVTTNDLLLQFSAVNPEPADPATKEALRYLPALLEGSRVLDARRGFSTEAFIDICHQIKPEISGVRRHEVYIGNPYVRRRTYTPPSDYQVLHGLLNDLARYMNDDTSDVDPLIRMAIGHYQFEAIHPFMDGNGRTGRVLNVLYLQRNQLLNQPILYLSEYILNHRTNYYEELRRVTFYGEWENWIVFILTGVATVARHALRKVRQLTELQREVRRHVDASDNRPPSGALLDLLFEKPYCTVEDVQRVEDVSRPTATRRLRNLESAGVIESKRLWRHRLYYIPELIEVLTEGGLADEGRTFSGTW